MAKSADILMKNLFEACSDSVDPVNEITKIAYNHFGRPVNVMDETYSVLSQYPQTSIGEQIWDEQLRTKSTGASTIFHYYSEKMINELMKAKRPILVDWGVASQCPRIAFAIKHKNNDVIGLIGLLCPNGEYNECDFDDLYLVSQALKISLTGMKEKSTADCISRKFPIEGVMLSILFSGKLKTAQDIEHWQSNTHVVLKPGFRIVSVPLEDTAGQPYLLSNLQKHIPGYHEGCLAYYSDQTLFLLLTQQTVSNPDSHQIELLSVFFHTVLDFNLQYGISEHFTDLANIELYKYQASRAAELCAQFSLSGKMHYFESVAVLSVLSSCVKDLEKNKYMHRSLEELTRYDKIEGTNYRETLEEYVMNLGNSKETSQKLFIHRNTLTYRMNRIEEILGINLSDAPTFLHIMISIYLEKFLK